MRPARRSHRAMADTKSRTCDRLDSSCESLPTAHGRLRSDFAIRTRKTLRATIGSYPQVSLEIARKRAREMAAEVGAGKNPIDNKRAERRPYPHVSSAG